MTNLHSPHPATLGPVAAPPFGGQPEGSRSWVWLTQRTLEEVYEAEHGPRQPTDAVVLPFSRPNANAVRARKGFYS